MLQEFCRQILSKGLNNVIVIAVIAAAPALKTAQSQMSKQRIVCCTAEARIIQHKGISLMITDETHNLRVISLRCGTAVMTFGRPVLPGRIIFTGSTEFCTESPAKRIDLLRDLTCLPGILIPYIQIDEIKIFCVVDIFRHYTADRLCICYRLILALSGHARPFVCIQSSVV